MKSTIILSVPSRQAQLICYFPFQVFQFYEEFLESFVAKGVGIAVKSVRQRLTGEARQASTGGGEGSPPEEPGPESKLKIIILLETQAILKQSRCVTGEHSPQSKPEFDPSVHPVTEEAPLAEDQRQTTGNEEEEEEESLASLINVKARFHLGILMIWFMAFAVTAPSLLSWVVRFK